MEIRFGIWTLRGHPRELWREGRVVPLQEHPLMLLEALLEKPGQLVSRQALISRLWPKRVVDYDVALNATVKRLRSVLGDDAEAPRYIETLPRKGYRFVGTVTELPDAPASTPRRMPWLRIAAAILLPLAVGGIAQVAMERPAAASPDGGAQGLVLQAQFFLKRRGVGDLGRAVKYFEEAIALDERNAHAWTGLASASFLMTMEGGLDRQAGFEKLRAAAKRAIELDPQLAEPRARLAQYHAWQGDAVTAAELRRSAAKLDPGSPLVMAEAIGLAYDRGELSRAIDLSIKALDRDPLSFAARQNLGYLLLMDDRLEEALQLDAATRLLHPGQASHFGALALILSSRAEEALQIVLGWPEDAQRAHCLALIHHSLGRRAESDAQLSWLTGAAERIDPFLIAEVHAFRGERDLAFHWLDEGTRASRTFIPGRRVPDPVWVQTSPLLRSLHADPRWRAWTGNEKAPAALAAGAPR